MDFLTAAVMIVLITAATVVLVVKFLSSKPARIAAVLAAVAVLFGVLPRIFVPLSPTPTAPAPTVTVTVAPAVPGTPSVSPTMAQSETPTAGGVF